MSDPRARGEAEPGELLMYGELAPWWPLLSRPEDYALEAALYEDVIDAAAERPVRTLLELGSGGGNNASHLKARYTLTLVDRAPGMLAVSRAHNPECEHLEGDMRTLRLGRTFDAVLIHDAICYMTSEAELAAAITTAAAHLAPGGVALFVPDDTVETYRPELSAGGHDGPGGRAACYLQWAHPYAPETDGCRVRTTYAYLLRDGNAPVRVLHEEHLTGLFPQATWLATIEAAGLRAEARPYEHTELEPGRKRMMFLGVAPPR